MHYTVELSLADTQRGIGNV